MDNLDAAAVAQQALKLGLLTPAQLQEGWDEVGEKAGEAEPLLLALERKGHLTPWQSGRLLKGELHGYFLGGYRILYKIAAGSFGRVYRGDDPRTGRVVAIKVLRRKWSDDKHGIELFEREGKLGLALKHPNIVEILAVDRDPVSRQYYIVMEFVEGGNLRELLRIRKKLEPAEALRLLDDAATGLAYAASRGISHRDMKLTNILIATQGTAKLVDFGLAGMEQLVHKAQAGQVDRTVDYAGLERSTHVAQGDIRSDVFFFGCVAYELLTGRPPLETPRDKRRRMLKERFAAVAPISPDEMKGPPSVVRLVETMMSLDPRARFQTPVQMLEGIREVRRELEAAAGKAPARSLFIVERDERLQSTLRDKFKELGFRVYLATDPVRALDRYRQQPYSALITDVRTVGEDSLYLSERVFAEAERQGNSCAGILILSDKHADLADRVRPRPSVAVLVGNVTLKQLQNKLDELLQSGVRSQESAASKTSPDS
jgi:serine/threonine protein kinase